MAGKLTLPKICESFGIFFLIWTVRVLCLSGFPPAGQSLWIQQLLAELLKGILWIGFAFYMIQRYHTRLWLKPQKMLFHPIAPRSLVLPAALFVLYFLVGNAVRNGAVRMNPDFHPSMLIGTVLAAGIFEEFLFRGWFYNACASVMERSFANYLSSAFFVLIHYPGWLYTGCSLEVILGRSIGIYVLGLIFGWSFRRSRSIWPPVFLHMLWNLLSITIGV